ncbi:Isochorismatase family protein [Propionibacterium freudenreichii]|uniref:hydrolase n=1 Tax=Propionibacterium freudenreichii TaxID=1744 RepID=UPI000BC2E557|nr:hydrolase [Propionibacterium freudenreichii]MDK9662093.1 hydrolase [Propionibacterium freudenreichii]SBN59425.1 Isochorismatase family protein [Propionibacterium freudenreichii]SCQ47823.1 Isochorismatase family protein [Propionibacterium freudenreichii]SCQ51625.1 Isochorismatase family protein [Propionibacterium freudenreichii]
MTRATRRDPVSDELLTPENSAFVLIDYQPTQVDSINSMDRAKLIDNIAVTTKIIQTYKVPVVLSTVNVANGRNKDTIPQLKELLPGVPSYDRTAINAWEDADFKKAVEATGRKKLIIAALWTEACLTFPTLDAIREGYEVYPVVDAVGGTSVEALQTALRRVEQAGAQLISIAQLACELQRDWNRTDTAGGFVEDLIEAGIFLKLE